MRFLGGGFLLFVFVGMGRERDRAENIFVMDDDDFGRGLCLAVREMDVERAPSPFFLCHHSERNERNERNERMSERGGVAKHFISEEV